MDAYLTVPRKLEHAVLALQERLGKAPDIVCRRLVIPALDHRPAALVYIKGLVHQDSVQTAILTPLQDHGAPMPPNLIRCWWELLLPASPLEMEKDLRSLATRVLSGEAALLVQGEGRALAIQIQDPKGRDITEPSSEPVLRGPHEGFVESMETNLALLRRRLRTPELSILKRKIGKRSQTQVALVYLRDIANPLLVQEACQRLRRVEIDILLDSGQLEELCNDAPFSPLPTMRTTERPDAVAANLLEGRLAIFVDGSPGALLVPAVLFDFLSPPEDYYERYHLATFLRWLRLAALIFALVNEPFYVAITTFHQELLPTVLLLRTAGAAEGVPLPHALSVLLMDIIFEGLREAASRMPLAIGGTLSIVGGVVLGETAVRAGLIAADTVLVVGLTGVAAFASPAYGAANSLRLLRFPLVLAAAIFGMTGLAVGTVMVLTHLLSLRSFGVPYLTPLAPMNRRDWKDTLVRAPWWQMTTRPHLTRSGDVRRQRRWARPRPPDDMSGGQG